MPSTPAYACAQPGCPELAAAGTYCEGHGKAQGVVSREERGSFRDRGYPADWEKRRLRILQRDPVCKACGVRFSDTVDHILPLDRGGSNDSENLQGLDASCHSKKTSIERGIMDPAQVMARLIAEVRR